MGHAFLGMVIWRAIRNWIYRAMGMFNPGWRMALVLLLARDRYADHGTMNPSLYSDPRFEQNLLWLEDEIRRLRRGGEPVPLELPHDVPPGAKEVFLTLRG